MATDISVDPSPLMVSTGWLAQMHGPEDATRTGVVLEDIFERYRSKNDCASPGFPRSSSFRHQWSFCGDRLVEIADVVQSKDSACRGIRS